MITPVFTSCLISKCKNKQTNKNICHFCLLKSETLIHVCLWTRNSYLLLHLAFSFSRTLKECILCCIWHPGIFPFTETICSNPATCIKCRVSTFCTVVCWNFNWTYGRSWTFMTETSPQKLHECAYPCFLCDSNIWNSVKVTELQQFGLFYMHVLIQHSLWNIIHSFVFIGTHFIFLCTWKQNIIHTHSKAGYKDQP